MKQFLVTVLLALSIPKMVLNGAAFATLKWNKNLAKFEHIAGVSCHELDNNKNILPSLRDEKYTFNGQPLRIVFHQSPAFFNYYENDTKVTGIIGDIWTTMSALLNFTLVLTKRKENAGISYMNGSYGGLLEWAVLNRTDVIPKMEVAKSRIRVVRFAPVFWMNSHKIFATGQWKRNRGWMFNLFTIQVWSLIIVFIATLSLASIFTQNILIHHRNRKLRGRSSLEHVFYTFATLCNQGHVDNTGSGSRVLMLTISIFSWLTLIGYSSRLIYSMAQEVFDAPFDDLETLLTDTNFRIVVLEGSVGHATFDNPYTTPIFNRIKKANRITVVKNVQDLYTTVCLNPDKYVLFHGNDAVAARRRKYCRLLPVGKPYFEIPVASGINRKSFTNKRSIDIGIMKLREYGLIDAIKKRYISSNNNEPVTRQTDSLTIDMDRVYLIFALLGIGMIASIVICIMEIIAYAMQNRNNIKSLGCRFPAVNQELFGTPVLTRAAYKK